MTPIEITAIVFVCVFSGALVGMLLRRTLPDHHLNADSRDVIKLGMALVASMSALVLSLLVASAKGSYDAQRVEFIQMAANFLQVDHVLARYGPETEDARSVLRQVVADGAAGNWTSQSGRSDTLHSAQIRALGDTVFQKVEALTPHDDAQRETRTEALALGNDIGRTRSMLMEQGGSSIPTPFLVVLIFWLTILFMSFGMLAPTNPTIAVVLCVAALSVSGAIFLILELDRPFEGIIQISTAPLQNALQHLGH